MKDFCKVILVSIFCLTIGDIQAQLPPNYLGLSVDSIRHLAKVKNYKFIDSAYVIDNSVFEVEYTTDFDWKIRKNSVGNSMWRCVYMFYSKDKTSCIECHYAFHIISEMDYFTQLLNNDHHFIKDGTYRTSDGWNSIDDKSYAFIEEETDMGARFNIVYRLRAPK